MPMIAEDREKQSYYTRKCKWFGQVKLAQKEKDKAVREALLEKLQAAVPRPKEKQDNEVIVRKRAA